MTSIAYLAIIFKRYLDRRYTSVKKATISWRIEPIWELRAFVRSIFGKEINTNSHKCALQRFDDDNGWLTAETFDSAYKEEVSKAEIHEAPKALDKVSSIWMQRNNMLRAPVFYNGLRMWLRSASEGAWDQRLFPQTKILRVRMGNSLLAFQSDVTGF